MPKNPDTTTVPKKVIAVRQDLLPRLIQKAGELKQNPNQLANLLMEGGLDAMDADGSYDSPIVHLYRTLKGKSLLTSKAVMTICSLMVPEIFQIEQHEKKILLDLINRHDGPLTPSILKGYRQLAVQMNKDRLEHERQFVKLQRTPKSR
jgi:hypothetical protein